MGTRSVWRLEIDHENDISSTEEMTVTGLEEEILAELRNLNVRNLHLIEIEDVDGFWDTPVGKHFREKARNGASTQNVSETAPESH